VVALLCLAQFVIVLDVTIVAIALPAVQADLAMSTTALGWVITAYTLTFGGCLLAAGRLADRVGRRRAFAVGLSLFGLASLACGLAPTVRALLAARALQGMGAALVAPSALALLTAARADARALGWWTAAAAGGGASGWLLGGLLSAIDWRWVFLVNVPLCAAAAALSRRVLPAGRSPRPVPLNARAAALATAGLAALVLGLTLLEERGPGAPATLVALATALALLAALALSECRARAPLLDPRLLRRPGVASANLVAAALTATTTPPMFLCILYAQRVLRLDPASAGLLFPPFSLAVVAGSLAGPRVVAAVGERAAMAGGLLTVAGGALALLGSLLGGFVALGTGLGVASVASTARGTRALDGAHRGLASGLLNTSAQVGTALGLALIVPLATHDFEVGFMVAGAVAGAAALITARAA
jgi:MFS family permease